MVSQDTSDPKAGQAEGSPAVSRSVRTHEGGHAVRHRPEPDRQPSRDRKNFFVSVAGSALGRLLADAVHAVVERIVDLIL
ncbi:hypothetical protein ACIBCN_13220 [Nocardia sp. NPDC051052]|uniref:hypothetical protein n=1 Tax=Nocardia sp. NPDC051052 TaxID=3364322 RepID=UPI00378B9D71